MPIVYETWQEGSALDAYCQQGSYWIKIIQKVWCSILACLDCGNDFCIDTADFVYALYYDVWRYVMPDPNDMFVKHRDFWMTIREALLSVVDVIEKKICQYPTTSEIRKAYKEMIAKQIPH